MEEASLEKNWFYESDGEKKGPVTEKEIGELIRSGTVTAKSHVWKQGLTDWKSVEETELNTYVDKSVPPVVQVKCHGLVACFITTICKFYLWLDTRILSGVCEIQRNKRRYQKCLGSLYQCMGWSFICAYGGR